MIILGYEQAPLESSNEYAYNDTWSIIHNHMNNCDEMKYFDCIWKYLDGLAVEMLVLIWLIIIVKVKHWEILLLKEGLKIKEKCRETLKDWTSFN